MGTLHTPASKTDPYPKAPIYLAISAALINLIFGLSSTAIMVTTTANYTKQPVLQLLLHDPFIGQSLLGALLNGLFAALIIWLLAWGRIEQQQAFNGPKAISIFSICLILISIIGSWYTYSTYFLEFTDSISNWLSSRGLFGQTYFAIKVVTLFWQIIILIISFYIAYFASRSNKVARAIIPKKRTVAIACALMYTCLLWQIQDLISAYLIVALPNIDWMPGLFASILGTLFIFAIAYLGASLGTGHTRMIKPARVFTASILCLIVQLCLCFILGVMRILWRIDNLSYNFLTSQTIELLVFVTVVYFLLLLALMRWFTGMLYERIQA